MHPAPLQVDRAVHNVDRLLTQLMPVSEEGDDGNDDGFHGPEEGAAADVGVFPQPRMSQVCVCEPPPRCREMTASGASPE